MIATLLHGAFHGVFHSALLLGVCPGCEPAAQDILEPAEVTVQALSETAFCLNAGAANVGVFFGADGILVVDGSFLIHGPDLEATIARLYFDWRARTQGVPVPEAGTEPLPLRYQVTTHWHSDHTATNPYFGLAGARIIAHSTTRRRLAGDTTLGAQVMNPGLDSLGVPSITVEDSLSLHFNGEEVRILHLPFAHTDGDLVVWLTGSKVAFLGDAYWSEAFPYIELLTGGRPAAMVQGLERLGDLFPPDTTLMPGHGAPTGMDGLRAFHDMMADCDAQIRRAVAEGKSLQATYAMKMFGEYEDHWGDGLPNRVKGFIQLMWYCYAPKSARGLGELEKDAAARSAAGGDGGGEGTRTGG